VVEGAWNRVFEEEGRVASDGIRSVGKSLWE
jgi:hypothetical protein